MFFRLTVNPWQGPVPSVTFSPTCNASLAARGDEIRRAAQSHNCRPARGDQLPGRGGAPLRTRCPTNSRSSWSAVIRPQISCWLIIDPITDFLLSTLPFAWCRRFCSLCSFAMRILSLLRSASSCLWGSPQRRRTPSLDGIYFASRRGSQCKSPERADHQASLRRDFPAHHAFSLWPCARCWLGASAGFWHRALGASAAAASLGVSPSSGWSHLQPGAALFYDAWSSIWR